MLLIEKESIFERENSSAINRIKIALEENRSFYLFINDKTSYDYAMKLLSTKDAVWGSNLPLIHSTRTFKWYQQRINSVLEVNFSLYTKPKYKVGVAGYTRMEHLEQIHLG